MAAALAIVGRNAAAQHNAPQKEGPQPQIAAVLDEIAKVVYIAPLRGLRDAHLVVLPSFLSEPRGSKAIHRIFRTMHAYQ